MEPWLKMQSSCLLTVHVFFIQKHIKKSWGCVYCKPCCTVLFNQALAN